MWIRCSLVIALLLVLLCRAFAQESPNGADPEPELQSALIAEDETWEDNLPNNYPGDELWNAYYAELWWDMQWRALEPDSLPVGALPDSAFIGWDERFGSDPRYWQLRWWNARMAQLVAPDDEAEDQHPNPLQWLEQGVDRGTTDFATDWLLFIADKHRTKTEIRVAIESMPEDSSATDRALAFEQQRIRLMAEIEELTRRYPSYSLPWYELGLLRCEWGDFEGGLGSITTGNAAEVNTTALPFPWSRVYGMLRSGEVKQFEGEDDWAVGAVVCGALFGNDTPQEVFRDVKSESLTRVSLGAGPQELSTLHMALCRYGGQEGAGLYQQHNTNQRALTLTRYVLSEPGLAESAGHRDGLLALYHRELRLQSTNSQSFQTYAPRLEDYLLKAMARADVDPGMILSGLVGQQRPELTDWRTTSYTWMVLDGCPPYSASTTMTEAYAGMLQLAYFQWLAAYAGVLYGDGYAQMKRHFDTFSTLDILDPEAVEAMFE